MNLWKNWVKSFILLWRPSRCPDLCYPRPFSAFSCTSQLIWSRRLLNCQFLYGRHFLSSKLFVIPVWFCFGFSIERLPFNWRDPIGYSMAVSLQIIIASYPFRYLACFVTFALGGYLFTITMANDVIDVIKSINDDLKSEIDTFKKLSKLFNLHSDAKQLSWTTAHFIKPYEIFVRNFNFIFSLIGGFSSLCATTITALFAGSTIAISIALLMIQLAIVQFILF